MGKYNEKFLREEKRKTQSQVVSSLNKSQQNDKSLLFD